jgi:4-amino-4-deoxy-L-arabinose transferase-like glycosyltransferase
MFLPVASPSNPTAPAAAQSRRRYLLSAALALFAGLLLRLWFIAAFARVAGDTLMYGDIALNWLQHGVYGRTYAVAGHIGPHPTLIRLPGYPLFLALCFLIFGADRYGAVLLLQAVLDLATCCLLAGLARRLFGPRAALPALWLGALCPFTAIYVATPLTETLTLLCIALAFYSLVRWQQAGAAFNRWLYALAFSLAYAILLRPEQGMLAACVVPAMVWIVHASRPNAARLRTLRPALIVSLLTLLPLVPWTLRNQRTFHRFQPLAPRYATDPGESNPYGFQRWYRTWAIDFASTETTYWPYEGDEIQIADLPNRAFDSQAQYAATEALLAGYNLHTTSTPAIDARFNALALDRIRANPLRYYVALPVARMLNMVFRPRAEALPLALEWWKFHLHPRATLIASALAAINLAYLTLGAVAFARRRALALNDPAAAPIFWAMAATIMLRCALLLTLDNSETRYTLEFYPILIVLAAGLLSKRIATIGSTPRSPARHEVPN